MSRKNGAAPTAAQRFEESVEQALITALNGIGLLEPGDKIKLLAVASRYVAIKARLVTSEHGSGFGDLDDEP